MTPRVRKLALTAHIVASVGWLGAVAAFLALAIAGLTRDDPQIVRAAYLAMDVTGWFVIVPLSFASLATGLIQSLGTDWGLFRHYWVLVKFLLNIGATMLLLLHMQPTTRIAHAASQAILSSSDLREVRVQLVADAVAALLVLLAATVLSVYKPWGVTEYGRRRLEARRKTASTIAPGHSPLQARPWGKYVLLGFAGLLLVVIVVHLMGGGLGAH
jgi:hypothetical protein